MKSKGSLEQFWKFCDESGMNLGQDLASPPSQMELDAFDLLKRMGAEADRQRVQWERRQADKRPIKATDKPKERG